MADINDRRPIDRDLLRRAGEHLGTLAENAKDTSDLSRAGPVKTKWMTRYGRLARASRDVLEIANG